MVTKDFRLKEINEMSVREVVRTLTTDRYTLKEFYILSEIIKVKLIEHEESMKQFTIRNDFSTEKNKKRKKRKVKK